MVADAVIVEEEWLEDEIYRLMDPISNNNPYLRDYFLSNMYRILSYRHNFPILMDPRYLLEDIRLIRYGDLSNQHSRSTVVVQMDTLTIVTDMLCHLQKSAVDTE